ncbi:MAG: HAD family hydrolase [Candidatus Jordarchaeum sp.]|uniref:HAD family hydrolase n=1 Tax=Candidatus Jordarchaeum sp. TaxID=2823881 RepID=UPI00404B3319
MKAVNDVHAVLLDLDGTLVNTRTRFFLVFNESLEKFNLPTLTKNTFEDYYNNASLDLLVPQNVAIQFWDHFLENYSKTSSPDEFRISGSKQALHQLKKMGISIGIVTGRIASTESVMTELKKHELDNFVDVIVTRLKNQNTNDDYFSKEQNLLEALEKLCHKSNESMFVGDYITDIRSGKRIGALTVAVLSGGIKKEILAKEYPDFIIKSVAELPSIISGLNNSY